jgi:hypothetical protein
VHVGLELGKVFAHSDEDHAPLITAIESAVALDPDTLSKNPLRLKVTARSRIVLTAVSMSFSMRARSLSSCSTATKIPPSPT